MKRLKIRGLYTTMGEIEGTTKDSVILSSFLTIEECEIITKLMREVDVFELKIIEV